MIQVGSALPIWVQYVGALGPALVLIGALIAAQLAWNAARRDRWWARTQWAIDQTARKDDDEKALGLAVLDVLVERAPSNDERAIVRAVTDTMLERFTQYEGEDVEYVLDDDGREVDGGDEGQVGST